jgi:DNA-directed RNA polymerase subunit M/transcription elongation factor TFIIS
MADNWYYAAHEKKLGPFSSAQLKELAAAGQLLPSHTVWKEGVEKGVLAARVKNLFPAPKEEPPPAPEALSSCVAPQAQSSVAELAKEASPASSPAPAENQGPALQANTDEEQKPKSRKAPNQNQLTTRRLFRVVGSSGAVILGQDGTSVRYRKKCPKCGYEDSSMKTMAIRSGVNRDRFFCQKCRKLQQVEIQGAV